MSNLQQARVEAAARALFDDPLASGDYTWEEMVVEDNSRAELWRDDARRVLAAADAAVTVEMIAECIADVSRPFVTGEWASGNFQARIARAVLALIRGGGEQ